MKIHQFLPVIFLLCSVVSYAQPVWSPGKRAEMESKWMQDSLHITSDQMQKLGPILLTYQQDKDKAGGVIEKEHEVMKKKDTAVKKILDKEQYKIYYRREKQIRALPKIKHTGPHQAY